MVATTRKRIIGLGVVATLAAGLCANGILAPAARAEGEPAGILTYTQALVPDAIRLIQSRLHDAGAYQGTVDGTWGSDSAAALRTFQQTRGLQVTGQVNQATAVTLGINPVDLVGATPPSSPAASAPAPSGGPSGSPSAATAPASLAPGTPAPAPATPAAATPHRAPVPLTSTALRLVQIRLREGGYYTGAADGVWGPGSQAALVRLQQTRGLPVTGRIDAASVQALGFDPNSFPPPS